MNKERARSGEARTSSKLSREDISSGRRGGLRSHRKGPRGRTRDQLYEEAKNRNIRGRSKMSKAELQRRSAGGRRRDGAHSGVFRSSWVLVRVIEVREESAHRRSAVSFAARSREERRASSVAWTSRFARPDDRGRRPRRTQAADADFLSVLHRSGQRVREAGGRLALVCADSRLRRLLDVTLLSWSLPVYETREEALAG